MRIAQIAPLYESVPPKMYGGTERVVYNLTEELVAQGHQVTVFASGDSRTSARLVSCCEQGLRLDGRSGEGIPNTIVELSMVYDRASEFDVIHNHVDYFALLAAQFTQVPTVTTMHGRLDLPPVQRVLRHFRGQPLVAISNAQRDHVPAANWIATVYNGIVPGAFTFRSEPGRYLAFLGRIAFEKRPDRAIEIARAVGMPLRIAAKVDPQDVDYFEHAIKPLLKDPLVEFIGEIDDRVKDDFLGNAYAYLFPIDWPEPFGMTVIEAMAAGTPVIAMNGGSVAELVEHERTGFVCHTLEEMIEAVDRVGEIDRADCRARVEEHFCAARMSEAYEAVYREVLAREREPIPA